MRRLLGRLKCIFGHHRYFIRQLALVDTIHAYLRCIFCGHKRALAELEKE